MQSGGGCVSELFAEGPVSSDCRSHRITLSDREAPLVPVSAHRFGMVDQALWEGFIEDEGGQPVYLVFHQSQMTGAFARVED